MFNRVMIANRGEIAVRIAQTVQELGAQALGVYSEVDRDALHIRACDEAFALGGKTPAESYLDVEKLLSVARAQGVDAIHPGYGFLSENEGFARACAEAGIVFVGPSPEVIRDMGDKIIAKQRLSDAGVPTVPGWVGAGDTEVSALQQAAAEIGYPVLLKAAAGGGGKGMRRVESADELAPALEAARREAASAFGDERVFLEKYIDRPRHIEVQIFGDTHGNVVHLFERECSIQRRYQKIIEEAPSPFVDDALRAKICGAAVDAARALEYTSAGTVEFIVAPDGAFYFLEVNTRLQVEHPITEMITGQDLVRAQLLVAAGERLPFDQQTLSSRGHALECRIYAEDPARGFLPSTGELRCFEPPVGRDVRLDTGFVEGGSVTSYYDPMLAKLITWGSDRSAAIARMRWALANFPILGVTTNIGFLDEVLRHPAFAAGNTHTHFLDEHDIGNATTSAAGDGAVSAANDPLIERAMLIAAALSDGGAGAKGTALGDTDAPAAPAVRAWQQAGPWSNT